MFQSQLCYVDFTTSIYSCIKQTIDEFTLNSNYSHTQKRILLLSGCENEQEKDPCYFTNYKYNNELIQFTIINTINIGNNESTIINPYNHLSCLVSRNNYNEKQLFVIEKYDTKSWKKVINNFKYEMCGINNYKQYSNSPTIAIQPSIFNCIENYNNLSIEMMNTLISFYGHLGEMEKALIYFIVLIKIKWI